MTCETVYPRGTMIPHLTAGMMGFLKGSTQKGSKEDATPTPPPPHPYEAVLGQAPPKAKLFSF